MCDVRKGTSTRKPRLNPQLVAQQVAQAHHVMAAATAAVAPKPPQSQPQERSDDRKERKPVPSALSNSNPEEKVSKRKIRNIRPRLKNVDRSQVHSQPVTVNNITVMITEYLPKPAPSTSSQSQTQAVISTTEESTVPVNTKHSEMPNGIHLPPEQSM